MYFSKVKFKPGKEFFNLVKINALNSLYATHQLLWDLFPGNASAKRDFLFRKIERGTSSHFLVVSVRMPVSQGCFEVETKPYKPIVKTGQYFAFSLIANPVVAKKTEGKKNSIKHDVWMDAKKEGKENELPPQELIALCEKRTKEWLVSRAEGYGFLLDIDSVSVDGYIQHSFYKKNNGKPVQFSSVNYEGVLTVNDELLFQNTLFNGIGKSKAFGCGLLLVRRI